MKIKDLKSVAYSNHGNIQWAVVYDYNSQKDLMHGSVECVIKEYGDLELTRIQACEDLLVLEVRE